MPNPRLLDRRRLLRYAAAGFAGASSTGWLRTLAASNAGGASRKSVVVLWMNGGPSTIDLWDLKPGHENGGPFNEIATAAPGVRISEHLPRVASWTKEMAIVRSMTTREGDHERATHLVRTGYVPQASIDFPDLGALVANEAEGAVLPNYVSIAPPQRTLFNGGGFLGPSCSPLVIGKGAIAPEELRVENLRAARGDGATDARASLLEQLDSRFVAERPSRVAQAYHSAAERAIQLMRPEVSQAFDLTAESEASRDRYGRTLFGQSCLLARRLVERGVPFVEATLDGWDTHQQNFDRVAKLSGQLDTAMSALLTDLRDRRLLESTLVVCLGEFGRTPRINGAVGRDHWPQAWSAVLAGGGIQGGQVVGRTSEDGATVESRPIAVPDLIATVCRAVGIDPGKQNDSNVGRPIRIADPDATPIEGVV